MSKSAIKVFIRTKPTSNFAQDSIKFQDDKKSLSILTKKKEAGFINNQQDSHHFSFDEILDNVPQEAVYDKCAANVVQSVLDGYNGTLLCYGQTGAGKTFTMTGAAENYKHRGVIPRTLAHIFKEVKNRTDSAITVRISYVELYNENIYDLLSFSGTAAESNKENNSGNSEGGASEELKIVEDALGNTHIMGLTHQIANSEEEALHLFFEGETNRAIAEHQLNKSSTRSHCIFTIHLDVRSRVESSEKITLSKLNLVDLAGSERLKKTGSEGIVMREAMFINKSLTFLEQVIIALGDKHRDHIPYRQCKLTNILKDSLGGNCKTTMIANIWVEPQHLEETVSTLRFATRMMGVSNEPVVNVTYDPAMLVKKYEKDIKDLKAELAMHDALSGKSHVQYEPYTDAQRAELNLTLRKYMNEEIDDVEVINLRQIKELLYQFRVIYKDLEREIETKVKSKYVVDKTDDNVDIQAPHVTIEEEGVGEIESSGFAVGLAPSTKLGGVSPRRPSKLKLQPKQGTLSTSPTIQRAKSAVKMSPPGLGPTTSSTSLSSSSNVPPAGSNQPSSATLGSGGAGNSTPTGSEKEGTGLSGSGVTRAKPSPARRASTIRHKAGAEPSDRASSSLDKSDKLIPPPTLVIDDGSKSPDVDKDRPKTPAVIKEEEKKKEEKRPPPADKNVAFLEFKTGAGSETNQKLTDNTEISKEKKRLLKNAATAVNAAKQEIDDAKTVIDNKKQERASKPEFSEVNGDEESAEIIDEEEFAAISKLRDAKKKYREAYDVLKNLQTEVEYINRMVDQCRQKLISDFDTWYNNTFLADNAAEAVAALKEVAVTKRPVVSGADVLDYQEKFEQLGLQRRVQQEPEAAAYYSAVQQSKEHLKAHTKKKPAAIQRSNSPLKSKRGSKWV